jgi:hypothetical protein
MAVRRLILVSVVTLGTALPSAIGAQGAPAAGANAPVSVRGSCDASGDVPVLRVQIVNTGAQKTSVVVGFTPTTNAQAHVVNSLDVMAIRPATGANDDYVYVNPKYALAKGAPWIVSIAPGASHDIELPMKDFISTLTYSSLDPLIAGGTRLIFESRKAAGQPAGAWYGKVETMLAACKLV